jgi:Zn-dependent metalloprotease
VFPQQNRSKSAVRLFVLPWLGVASLITSIGAQTPRGAQAVSLTATSTNIERLQQSDDAIDRLLREGRLERQARVFDTLASGADHQRLQQRHHGVPIWASTITLQRRSGVPVSSFGEVYDGLDGLDPTPALTAVDARARAAAFAGVELGQSVPAALYVLASHGAPPRLAYVVRAVKASLLSFLYFIDAQTGALIEERMDTRLQTAAVGIGVGVIPGNKKISASALGGQFVLADLLRPQQIQTFDMRGDVDAVLAILNGTRTLSTSDLGTDSDNRWTDPALVDAHVYSGWTYDYLFKRFNRLGLEGEALPVINIVHPARREDIFDLVGRVPQFFANAGYFGGGVQVYGDGLPEGVVLDVTGQRVDFLSGALDIVAHEVAHGLTEHLEYLNEPGALTETFSDVIGTGVEFFFQQPGNGAGQADYTIGEDVLSFGAIRSLSRPPSAGNHPEHYSKRYLGPDDNGGVHVNAGIGNNVFYLAIEGGINGTSEIEVTGVGARNREQIEKIFYRAFTLMLPARATFSNARDATIQAARDLYGAGSAAEVALRDAWTAVGVFSSAS